MKGHPESVRCGGEECWTNMWEILGQIPPSAMDHITGDMKNSEAQPLDNTDLDKPAARVHPLSSTIFPWNLIEFWPTLSGFDFFVHINLFQPS